MEDGGAGVARSAQERFDAGREFTHRKRLDEIVVSAGFKPADPLIDGGKRAHDQHRNSYAFFAEGLDH